MYADPNCPLCNLKTEDVLFQDASYEIIWAKNPVVPGHIQIISATHSPTFFDHTTFEQLGSLGYAIVKAKTLIEEQLVEIEGGAFPDGYNLLMSDKEAAGQTIPHFHLDLIPRYNNDQVQGMKPVTEASTDGRSVFTWVYVVLNMSNPTQALVCSTPVETKRQQRQEYHTRNAAATLAKAYLEENPEAIETRVYQRDGDAWIQAERFKR